MNLVIHDIVSTETEKHRTSDLTWQEVSQALKPYQRSQVRLYVDDGYVSILNYLEPIQSLIPSGEIHLAIITNLIDTPEYLSSQDLRYLDQHSIQIDSHSTSHAALTPAQVSSEYSIPTKGLYQDHPYSKTAHLSFPEIHYQLQESQNILTEILGHPVEEFVLPFGWYTEDLLSYIQSTNIYSRISVTGKFPDTHEIRYREIILS